MVIYVFCCNFFGCNLCFFGVKMWTEISICEKIDIMHIWTEVGIPSSQYWTFTGIFNGGVQG